jgi:hypothetical protein
VQPYPQVAPPVIRTYEADSYEGALRQYQEDAVVMAQHGYQPVGQQWVADDAGRGCFWIVIIVILFITIIGILLLPFVLGGRKRGRLTVTYVNAGQPVPPRPLPPMRALPKPDTVVNKTFTGRSREEVQSRFARDLEEARQAGWVPVSERWDMVGNEHILMVAYRRA